MPQLTLPVGSLITITYGSPGTTITLSEHNRQPASISIERIEKTQRMSNGTLRKFYIADKKSLSISWSDIPSRSTYTVDGFYGARDIKDFYESANGKGSFTVNIKYGNGGVGNVESLNMVFSSCSFEIVKRNAKKASGDTPQELWNVSLSMEEV